MTNLIDIFSSDLLRTTITFMLLFILGFWEFTRESKRNGIKVVGKFVKFTMLPLLFIFIIAITVNTFNRLSS
jgi:hypothetical protein